MKSASRQFCMGKFANLFVLAFLVYVPIDSAFAAQYAVATEPPVTQQSAKEACQSAADAMRSYGFQGLYCFKKGPYTSDVIYHTENLYMTYPHSVPSSLAYLVYGNYTLAIAWWEEYGCSPNYPCEFSWFPYRWYYPLQDSLSITANPPLIPMYSGVTNNHVYTISDLSLSLTEGGQGVSGVLVPLQSDRGTVDQILNTTPTDTNGNATSVIATRDQPGTSTVTASSSDIDTSQPATIQWLPAKYEGSFKITCYAVAQLSISDTGPMVTIPGIPGKYHKAFFSEVKMQGSGLINGSNGYNYIQRNWATPNLYKLFTCPHTASGRCAQAGQNVAVDPSVIPMSPKAGVLSNISIDGIGDRTAEDGGGWITGYHIDVFWGPTADDFESCLDFGVQRHNVTLLDYGN